MPADRSNLQNSQTKQSRFNNKNKLIDTKDIYLTTWATFKRRMHFHRWFNLLTFPTIKNDFKFSNKNGGHMI